MRDGLLNEIQKILEAADTAAHDVRQSDDLGEVIDMAKQFLTVVNQNHIQEEINALRERLDGAELLSSQDVDQDLTDL